MRSGTSSGASTRYAGPHRGSTAPGSPSSADGSLESVYRRLFENEWVAADDALVGDRDLRAAVQLDGPLPPQPNKRYVVAIDVGLKRDASVAVVAHAEPILNEAREVTGTRVLLDRIETWQGTRDRPVQLANVEGWVEQAARAYNSAQIILDPWQAVGMLQRLRTRGLRVAEYAFTAQSVGRLASTLHLLLRNRALALPDDEALLDELSHVRLRESAPGVVRLDHDSGHHDDRAIALALACEHLVARGFANPHAHGGFGIAGERSTLAEQLGSGRAPWDKSGRVDGSIHAGMKL